MKLVLISIHFMVWLLCFYIGSVLTSIGIIEFGIKEAGRSANNLTVCPQFLFSRFPAHRLVTSGGLRCLIILWHSLEIFPLASYQHKKI